MMMKDEDEEGLGYDNDSDDSDDESMGGLPGCKDELRLESPKGPI